MESARTYLAADQKDLFTDYTIRPLREAGAQGARTRPRPGLVEPTPVVVTRWGGRAAIDGVEVVQEDAGVPAFREGQEVVLLLAATEGTAAYRLASPVSGTFAVVGGRIEPWAKGAAAGSEIMRRVRGMSLAEFEAEVRRVSSRPE